MLNKYHITLSREDFKLSKYILLSSRTSNQDSLLEYKYPQPTPQLHSFGEVIGGAIWCQSNTGSIPTMRIFIKQIQKKNNNH